MWLWWRGRLFATRWYLWPAQHAWWIGFVAVICGWIVTETGRQPWVAYGVLRTADAVSPVAANTVATTLVLFVLVYGVVFAMGIYYINRLIARGPNGAAIEPAGTATRSAAAVRRGAGAKFSPRPDRRCRSSEPAKSRMAAMESYLPVIWAAIIGLAVAMYVILDGFDLGVGILFPFAESEHDRDQMMNSVAPFWDGNETWLVLGGAGMMVAFPLAYSIILPALYLPVIVMLLALVFRGVAFEFRWIGVTSKRHWTFAFAAGSALAAFCQGLILGGLIQGIKVENGAFAGGTVRLGDAVRGAVRPRPGGRLRPARRHLAGHEDRGRRRRAGEDPGARCCCSRCSPSWSS